MATNLLKQYNSLLDSLYKTDQENIFSFRCVFNRDFINEGDIHFRTALIYPLPIEVEALDRLFDHLTGSKFNGTARSYEHCRAIRIHWVKYHLLELKLTNMIISLVEDENTLYIVDKDERYGIFLEPLREGSGYFIKSAYPLEPSNYKRVMNRIQKRGRPI